MNNEQLFEYQRRWNEFIKTPVGAAFQKFENLHAMAWQRDTELGYQGGNGLSAKKAWAASDAARTELLKLLGFVVSP